MINFSMKNIMFCANDPEKHAVYWSELSQSFALENETKGRFFSSPFLCSALTQMHTITGQYFGPEYNHEEYRAQVPEQWTMTESPYG